MRLAKRFVSLTPKGVEVLKLVAAGVPHEAALRSVNAAAALRIIADEKPDQATGSSTEQEARTA